MASQNTDKTNSERQDGRQAMTVYLRRDLVKKLKMLSVKDERHAYLIVEEMIDDAFDNEQSKYS
jgi:predicted transcriptional regulator